MARRYESTQALCPFYKGEEKTTIYCEGVAPGVTTMLAFGRDAKDYKKSFCRSDWHQCKVAMMLSQEEDTSLQKIHK